MSSPSYAIMRFAKYKGPEIGRIEAHNERTKEKYASNPDIDCSRSGLNCHLIHPPQHYRAEAERQIAEAGCRVRQTASGWWRCFSRSAPGTSMINRLMKSVHIINVRLRSCRNINVRKQLSLL